MILRSPFPWFGGKSRVADLVWQRFGNPNNYVEPFFGSGAVLLARPDGPGVETINDADGYVCNFWRAIQHDPETVAHHADYPINECDLHARHAWLVAQKDDFTRKLEGDPDFYDAKVAGFWVWGICLWIGAGWCSGNGPWSVVDRKLVHLGDKGRGINRQLVHLGNKGRGINRQHENLIETMKALSNRLRNARICCGDWSRVCGLSPTTNFGLTAVLMDPPYDDTRLPDLYSVDSLTVSAEVGQWCKNNGDHPEMRIALCGYEGSFEPPFGWETVEWKAHGGYGLQGQGQARTNAKRERVWFSPHCLKAQQSNLF